MYQRRPELAGLQGNEYRRAYYHLARGGKGRRYAKRPELRGKKGLDYNRAYYHLPDVKSRVTGYFQRPDVQARLRSYRQRPEVKAQVREAVARHYRTWRGRNAYLLRVYGITQQQHEDMLASQDFRCAVCRDQEPKAIDHCHVTNKVRGLLCMQCNSAIGFAKDSPAKLRRMADYVQRHAEANGISWLD